VGGRVWTPRARTTTGRAKHPDAGPVVDLSPELAARSGNEHAAGSNVAAAVFGKRVRRSGEIPLF
jgi:hypothetical protein